MEMTTELFAYLSRAAQGDESECPPEIDVIWHEALAYPQAYDAYCLHHFGVLIDHVTDSPGLCKAQAHCRAVVRW